jgi:hypothetical protein
MLQISEEDLFLLALGAVRNALGRRSLQTTATCHVLRSCVAQLDSHHRESIIREIELQEALGYRDPGARLEWLNLLSCLRDLQAEQDQNDGVESRHEPALAPVRRAA